MLLFAAITLGAAVIPAFLDGAGDLEVAVQEGATQVRVGSALFGERPPAGAPVR
mgnify:CR=1 FL=1